MAHGRKEKGLNQKSLLRTPRSFAGTGTEFARCGPKRADLPHREMVVVFAKDPNVRAEWRNADLHFKRKEFD